MNSRLFASATVVAALCLGCAGAKPPPTSGPLSPGEPKLRELKIEGAKAIPEKLIRSRIATASSSQLPLVGETHYYDESVLETDLERILRLYRSKGYYKVRIAEHQVVTVGDNEVEVILRIDEGPPTTVEELEISGLGEVPEPERSQVLSDLPLKQGDVFDEDAYNTLKTELAERLAENGWAEAQDEGTVEILVASDTARIRIEVTAGPRFRFGAIFVAGANRVPRSKILDEVVRDIHEGQFYRESALPKARGRLFELGVFSAVTVTRGAPDRRNATMPIVVKVAEAPFRTLRLGAGFGFDPTYTELPRVNADWTNRNFFGGLRKLTFANYAALVFIPTIPSVFSKENPGRVDLAAKSTLQFNQPELFDKRLTLTSALGFERGVDPGYSYNSATGSVGVIWHLSRSLLANLTYNYSVFRLQGAAAQAAQNSPQSGAALDACAINNELCLLAYLEQRLQWDRRNNPVEATSGGLVSLSLQEGSHLLGGAYDYLRVAPEGRLYIPLGRHVLAMRLAAGMLVTAPGQTSSVITRFYAGGSGDQRGFGNRQLSPRYAVVDTTRDECKITATAPTNCYSALPIGGNALVGGNIEARLRLPASLGLVIFTDAGQVQPTVSELSVVGMQIAAGVGLRYRTVFGPVRLDFAYRVYGEDFKQAGQPTPVGAIPVATSGLPTSPPESAVTYNDLHLTLPRYSIHFSIGEAF